MRCTSTRSMPAEQPQTLRKATSLARAREHSYQRKTCRFDAPPHPSGRNGVSGEALTQWRPPRHTGNDSDPDRGGRSGVGVGPRVTEPARRVRERAYSTTARSRTRRHQKMERETGFEPATSTLARSHSTTELFPPGQRGRMPKDTAQSLSVKELWYHTPQSPGKTLRRCAARRRRPRARRRCGHAPSRARRDARIWCDSRRSADLLDGRLRVSGSGAARCGHPRAPRLPSGTRQRSSVGVIPGRSASVSSFQFPGSRDPLKLATGNW